MLFFLFRSSDLPDRQAGIVSLSFMIESLSMDTATLFTTDNQHEEFDVVNEDDVVIGTALRSEVHTNPALIHRSATVMVFDETGRLLLQKRSKTKDTYPGFWSPSCSGHVGRGEDYRTTAVREMAEELGLFVHSDSLHSLFTQLMRLSRESEYMAVFRYDVASQKQLPFSIHPQEVEEIRFMKTPEILRDYRHCITPDLEIILNRMNDLTN